MKNSLIKNQTIPSIALCFFLTLTHTTLGLSDFIQNCKNKALWRIAKNGLTPVVRLCLFTGADPNTRGQLDYPALHAAAALGHVKTARALLAKGADPTAQSTDGTALLVSVIENQPNVVSALLNQYDDYDALENTLNTCNEDGDTALSTAISPCSELIDTKTRTFIEEGLELNAAQNRLSEMNQLCKGSLL